MLKNSRYKNKPCGYCGLVTGRNQGEHVLPNCIYPSSTPSNLQRLKIPACPSCNRGWSDDEAHFKSVILAAGPDPSPERKELWQDVRRSLAKVDHGDAARFALLKSCVLLPILNSQGLPFLKVFPDRDPRVCRVVRKVVRGLEFSRDGSVIADHHVRVVKNVPIEDAELMERRYCVPNVFESSVFDFRPFYAADDESEEQVRSIWLVRFYEVPMTAIVFSKIAD